jgi:hypothetical protein
MALLLRSPVWWTVVSPALGIPEPSLPFVTLSRWMENLEASAILLNICDAGASDSMVMDSGRPLIGRPEGYVSSVLVGGGTVECLQLETTRLTYLEGARQVLCWSKTLRCVTAGVLLGRLFEVGCYG